MTVIDITTWQPAGEEMLGTKPKQWVRSPAGELWLWKESTLQRDLRHGTFRKGDDWSEVAAGRLGTALGLTVAEVELAVRGPKLGVVSHTVLAEERESLVHGNELLAEAGFAAADPHDRSGYSVSSVASVLNGVSSPALLAELTTAFEWFAGYRVLDVLVGNTDRHQDNWAVIRAGGSARLSPSFDHASCLGFQLSDTERLDRLDGKGNRTLDAYAEAARTKFDHGPSPVQAAAEAAERVSMTARAHWLRTVESAPELNDLLTAIPEHRMSDLARRFAAALYQRNRTALSHALRTMDA